MQNAAFWIEQLKLESHIEGGFFREVFQLAEGAENLHSPANQAGRKRYTSIYFLLEYPDFSAFHRLKSDEIWHFYAGHPLTLWIISEDGSLSQQRLGNNPAQGECFQVRVPALTWFAAQPDSGYALVGCTMAPGFDYSDLELAQGQALSTAYPQYQALIERFTRS